jgi:hypothetical protein
VAPELVWPKAGIPATGHYCFVAVLDQAEDPAPPIPGPTDWNGFLDIIKNHNNVTWRNFNVIDVQPDPAADPIAMPFMLAGDPGGRRRFDIEIAVHLPADAKLQLEMHPAAAAALPAVWRERITHRKHAAILDVPRLPAMHSGSCATTRSPEVSLPAQALQGPWGGQSHDRHSSV